MAREVNDRLEALRELLKSGEPSTQEELRQRLEEQDFEVTQSTVSRDLRKLGAVRAVDTNRGTVYRLPDTFESPLSTGRLSELVQDVRTNGSMIVLRTAVGSASLIARHLDTARPAGILGTIAGDDTIFIAPASTSVAHVKSTMDAIVNCLRPKDGI